jgi:hypothetical protein
MYTYTYAICFTHKCKLHVHIHIIHLHVTCTHTYTVGILFSHTAMVVNNADMTAITPTVLVKPRNLNDRSHVIGVRKATVMHSNVSFCQLAGAYICV